MTMGGERRATTASPGDAASLTKKRIGIVGTGIAGLSCAYILSQGGHDVTLFEREARPGMDAYGVDLEDGCVRVCHCPGFHCALSACLMTLLMRPSTCLPVFVALRNTPLSLPYSLAVLGAELTRHREPFRKAFIPI